MHPIILQISARPGATAWENFFCGGLLIVFAACIIGAVVLTSAYIAKEERKRKDAIASQFRQLGFGATSTPQDFERKLAFGELRDLPIIWKKSGWRHAYFPSSNPNPSGIVLIARGVIGSQQVSYIEHVQIIASGNRARVRLFDYCVLVCVPVEDKTPPRAGSVAEKISAIPTIAQWADFRQRKVELFRQDTVRLVVVEKRLDPEEAVSLTQIFATACNKS